MSKKPKSEKCDHGTPHPALLPGELALASSQLNDTASASGCGWEKGRRGNGHALPLSLCGRASVFEVKHV